MITVGSAGWQLQKSPHDKEEIFLKQSRALLTEVMVRNIGQEKQNQKSLKGKLCKIMLNVMLPLGC